MSVRAARGAIAVGRDDPETILEATQRVLEGLLERNELSAEDLVSVFFTATPDLTSVFPAEAARRMGLGKVPLLCAQEIPVGGSMPRVVRVLAHFETDRAQSEIAHVYLNGAESLRDDL